MFRKKSQKQREADALAAEFAQILDLAMSAAERKAQRPEDAILVVAVPGREAVVMMRQSTWIRFEKLTAAYLRSLPAEERSACQIPRSA